MARAGVLGLVAGALVAAATSTAAAQPRPTAQLDYAVEGEVPGCPSSGELRAAIAARLGYDPVQPGSPVLIRVRITRDAPDLRAVVQVLDEAGAVQGSRELTSAVDCAELGRALALAVSVAIDPFQTGRAVEPAVEPTAEPTPTTPAPPAGARDDRPAPPPRTLGTWLGFGLGGAEWRRPLVELGGGTGSPRLGLRGALRFVVPEERAGAGGGTLSTTRVTARLGLCPARGRWRTCLGGELGALRARSRGLDQPDTALRLVAALTAAVGAVQPASPRLAVAVDVGLDVALVRDALAIDHEPTYTTPAVAGWATLAMIVRWP